MNDTSHTGNEHAPDREPHARPRKMRKRFRVLWTLALSLLGLITILQLSLFLILRHEGTQRYLGRKAGQWLSERTQTEVVLERIVLEPPLQITLHHLRVMDHHQQELLYAQRLHTGLPWHFWQELPQDLRFGKTSIDSLRLHLRTYPDDGEMNLNRWLDSLRGGAPEPDTLDTSQGLRNIRFAEVQLHGGLFTLDDLRDPPPQAGAFDGNHMRVSDIEMRASGLLISEGDIYADIDSLSARERSGLVVNHMTADLLISSQKMVFGQLLLQTPRSYIRGEHKMHYDGYGSMGDFFANVRLKGALDSAYLDFRDLEPFSPGLGDAMPPIAMAGNYSGLLERFSTHDFSVQLPEGSYVEGDFEARGLPDLRNTFMEWRMKEAQLTVADARRLGLPEMVLRSLQRLGFLHLSGRLDGFLSDFVAYGQFESALGRFETDLNLKLPNDSSQQARYSGNIKTGGLQLGRLLGQPDVLGSIRGQAEVEGRGFSLDEMQARLNAQLQSLVVKGYPYQNIEARGTLRQSFFDGKLHIRDPNLGLDFTGNVDLAQERPSFAFQAELREAQAHQLGLLDDTLTVSTLIRSDFKGNTLDNAQGSLRLRDLRLALDSHRFEVDSVVIQAQRDSGRHRRIDIQSDMLSAFLEGRYRLAETPRLFRNLVSEYFNERIVALQRHTGPLDDSTHVHFGATLTRADFLSRYLGVRLNLTEAAHIQGSARAGTRKLQFSADVPGLFYDRYLLEGFKASGFGRDSVFSFNTRFDQLIRSGDTLVRRMDAYLTAANDSILLEGKAEEGRGLASLRLESHIDLADDTVKVDLAGTELQAGLRTWRVDSQALRVWDNQHLRFDNLRLYSDSQSIVLSGLLDSSRRSFVRARFDSVQIEGFRGLMPPSVQSLKGYLSGRLQAQDFRSLQAKADMRLTPFKIGLNEMGTLRFQGRYVEAQKRLSLSGGLRKDNANLLSFSGDVYRGDSVDFTARMNQTPLMVVQPFATGLVSELGGRANGRVAVTGKLPQPRVSGGLAFQDAGATIDYLQTHYSFSDSVRIDGQGIYFQDFVLRDRDRNTARVNGRIAHDYFSDWKLDLNIRTDKFLALDTDEDDNELFYGTAYCSGRIGLSGPFSNIFFDMELETEEGTREFVLPLTEGQASFTGANYIRYTDEESFFKRDYQVNLEGISMDFDLTVTPDARVSVVFDPQLKEKLEGVGRGNLNLLIGSDGEFEMYGQYVIEDGSYTFNSFDVIFKTFQLRENGVISWNGDPYNARLDVEAVYKTRASLEPLLATPGGDGEGGQETPGAASRSRRELINVLLGLEGELLSPDVSLDFALAQDAQDPLLQRRLQTIRNDVDERNKQVVSLLVLNRFLPTESSGSNVLSGDALQAGGETTAGELVSQLVNSFVLPQLGENVDLGINYNRNEALANQQSELQGLEVALGVSLLNDRVSLSGSYGVNQGRDVELRYKLLRSGNLQLKAFERNDVGGSYQTPYDNARTFGFGVFYQKRFNRLAELMPWNESPRGGRRDSIRAPSILPEQEPVYPGDQPPSEAPTSSSKEQAIPQNRKRKLDDTSSLSER